MIGKGQSLATYSSRYSQLKSIAKEGMQYLTEVLDNFPEHQGKITIRSRDEYSVTIQYLGFSILIRFMKNIKEEIGYLQWYYVFFSPERQKEESRIVDTYYFDTLGNMYKEKGGHAFYSFRSGFGDFFYSALQQFCQKVDEETCSEF